MTGTVLDRLAVAASARPCEVALVVDGGPDLTFGDWECRSAALARGLAERGIRAGDRVALRFEARDWASFAVAYLGTLKAGAVAALVPSGLAAADAARIVRHADARCVLGEGRPGQLAPSVWAATPEDVEDCHPSGGWVQPADATALAELVYPLAPLAQPRPCARTHAALVAPTALDRLGVLVHTWAPGSLAGQHALGSLLAGGGPAATMARFSPEALCALAQRIGATTCGLTPGLAAALIASEAVRGADLGAVTAVVLSAAAHELAAPLAARFPRAAVHHLPAPAGTAAEGEADPVGASQLGMLWHEQLAPGSFNLPALVRRYRGALDVGALEAALAELVRRHEPLRTTFDLTGGAPGQVVGQVGPSELVTVDLTHRTPPDREAETARMVAEASTRPFDLVEDPLFAPTLVRLGAEDHVLLIRLHHTAFDDWSVDVLRRDLSALYRAFLDGKPPSLPELTIRFAEVCRRQHARLAGPGGVEQLHAWRARLSGAPLPVQLQLGEPHQLGPDRPGAGEPLRHDLSPELARAVRALSPGLRATPFMTVLAAFEVLLGARTGQDDLVLASVVAGRGATALEPMIGCFTKKVLLRLQAGGDPTFPELVARTRSTVLEALARQDQPFEAVVQQTLGRSAARHGLSAQVPVIFQGESHQQGRLVLPGIEVGPFEVPASARRELHFSAAQHCATDATDTADTTDTADPGRPPRWGDGTDLGTFLLLSLLESKDGLALVARGVFHRPAAERLLLDLDALLADIVTGPARRLSELAARTERPPDGDDLSLLGLHLSRSRLETALGACPGVAEVAVAVAERDGEERLAASIVPDRHPAPTLAKLRAALWAAHPGAPWPAEAVILPPGATLPRQGDGRVDTAAVAASVGEPAGAADDVAALLTALWAAAGGGPAAPDASYWQDFTFLAALAQARAAGLPVTDEQVAHCRTPEMLAAALAAAAPAPMRPTGG